MNRVLKLEGIYPLLQVYQKLESHLGKDKLLEMAKNDPNFFFDFLPNNEKFVVNLDSYLENFKTQNVVIEKKIRNWTEKTASSLIEELALTALQKNILINIFEKKGNAIIDFLIEKNRHLFPDIKRKKGRKEGSVIGGALAGLSRKCSSKDIVCPYASEKDNKETIRYFIVEEAEVMIKILKELK